VTPALKTAPGSFRQPSRRLDRVRQASLAGMERYSQFVRVMKRALPAAAAAVALAVLIYALQPRETAHWALTAENQTRIDHDLTMVHPRLYGTDDGGSPFIVVADTAVQDGASALRVRLNKVRAQMTMKDGLWVQLEALHGLINSEQHQLDLTDGIRLTADGGYEAHTTRAHFDLTTGVVNGHDAVSGRGPSGTFTAHGFEVHKPERQLVFTGGVYMLLHGAPVPARPAPTPPPPITGPAR
jgi:lipopolysaccharide export system protein LptC